MSTSNESEFFNNIYHTLEPHASFLKDDEDNPILRFAPISILESLGWILLNYILPILTGVTTGVLTTYISGRISRKGVEDELIAFKVHKEDVEKLKQQVQEELIKLRTMRLVQSEQQAKALEVAIQILVLNGWPSDVARKDAQEILSKIISKVNQRRESEDSHQFQA